MNGLPDFSHNRDGLRKESDFKWKKPLVSVLATRGVLILRRQMQGKLKILNPWDVESHRVHDIKGVMSTLYRKDGGGGFVVLAKRKRNDLSEENRDAVSGGASRKL